MHDANGPTADSVQRKQFLLIGGQQLFKAGIAGCGECASGRCADPVRNLGHNADRIRQMPSEAKALTAGI
jgi:hypothetical protein